jgi:hypothetical protein
MLYYRYRPSGELYIKELMYNELYFTSTEESNDPYDGKVFLAYDFDQSKWQRTLEVAWKAVIDKDSSPSIINSLSEQLAADRLITYEEVMSCDYMHKILQINSNFNAWLALYLDTALKRFIDLYRYPDSYFVSFSKSSKNTLMWSHYASRHCGYCLVFKTMDGLLNMDTSWGKKTVRCNTPRGITATTGSFSLPTKFEFKDIKYRANVESIDAARFMPMCILGLGEFESNEERTAFIKENQQKYLEKHNCWEYENESRLVLSESVPWVFGQHNPLPKQDRLFHYDFSQLAGIIFGPKMATSEKERITSIVEMKCNLLCRDRDKNSNYSEFIICDSELSDRSQAVIVKKKSTIASVSIFNNSRLEFWDV